MVYIKAWLSLHCLTRESGDLRCETLEFFGYGIRKLWCARVATPSVALLWQSWAPWLHPMVMLGCLWAVTAPWWCFLDDDDDDDDVLLQVPGSMASLALVHWRLAGGGALEDPIWPIVTHAPAICQHTQTNAIGSPCTLIFYMREGAWPARTHTKHSNQ